MLFYDTSFIIPIKQDNLTKALFKLSTLLPSEAYVVVANDENVYLYIIDGIAHDLLKYYSLTTFILKVNNIEYEET